MVYGRENLKGGSHKSKFYGIIRMIKTTLYKHLLIYLLINLKFLKYTCCSAPLTLVMRSFEALMPPNSLPV